MGFANAGRATVAIVAEDSFGVAPASPSWRPIPAARSGLTLERDLIRTSAVTGTRQEETAALGADRVTGDIDVPLGHGVVDDLLEAALGGAWTTETPPTPEELLVGSLQRSFAIEHRFPDIGRVERFLGCAVEAVTFTVAPEETVRARIRLRGRTMELDTASAGATQASAALKPFVGYRGTLSEGGASLAIATGVEITVENRLVAPVVLGDSAAPSLLAGGLTVSGRLSALFADDALLSKFLNRTETSLSLTLDDGTDTLTVALPRVIYTGAGLPVTPDDGLVLDLPFHALFDPVGGTTIKLTRSNAV